MSATKRIRTAAFAAVLFLHAGCTALLWKNVPQHVDRPASTPNPASTSVFLVETSRLQPQPGGADETAVQTMSSHLKSDQPPAITSSELPIPTSTQDQRTIHYYSRTELTAAPTFVHADVDTPTVPANTTTSSITVDLFIAADGSVDDIEIRSLENVHVSATYLETLRHYLLALHFAPGRIGLDPVPSRTTIVVDADLL